jgi:hypothetical protein
MRLQTRSYSELCRTAGPDDIQDRYGILIRMRYIEHRKADQLQIITGLTILSFKFRDVMLLNVSSQKIVQQWRF